MPTSCGRFALQRCLGHSVSKSRALWKGPSPFPDESSPLMPVLMAIPLPWPSAVPGDVMRQMSSTMAAIPARLPPVLQIKPPRACQRPRRDMGTSLAAGEVLTARRDEVSMPLGSGTISKRAGSMKLRIVALDLRSRGCAVRGHHFGLDFSAAYWICSGLHRSGREGAG